ncbi:MAG: hypothetical protein SPI35_06000 [Porphyromonas sp.]|nr:hypothetical protein [Porphyromonas sp.]
MITDRVFPLRVGGKCRLIRWVYDEAEKGWSFNLDLGLSYPISFVVSSVDNGRLKEYFAYKMIHGERLDENHLASTYNPDLAFRICEDYCQQALNRFFRR